jgi:thermitase
MKTLLRLVLVCALVSAVTPNAWAKDGLGSHETPTAATPARLGVPKALTSALSLGYRENKPRPRVLSVVTNTASADATTSVVVGYEPAGEEQAIVSVLLMGAKVSRRAKSGGFCVVKVPPGADVATFIRELTSKPGVQYAEPDGIVRATMASNDPGFSSQWGMTKIGAPSAWDVTRGASVRVAVVDTGVDLDHPDLHDRIDTVNGWDFINGDAIAQDDAGHGTHVSGIIAATLNNGIGVAGVANQCTILPVKVLGANGNGTSSNVADGIRWAANHGASVINLSLGSADYSYAIDSAVQYAVAQDCVVVAATGNNGQYGVIYPARLDNVVGVGSTTSQDALSSFSNYGPEVDICAPGSDIYSTLYTGGYGNMSGTSMAAPHVAGVVALIRAKNPSWTRAQVEQQLLSTALDLGPTGRDNYYGYGRVQAAQAVAASIQPPPMVADDNIPGVVAPTSPITGSLDSTTDLDDVFRIYLAAGSTLTASLTGATGTDFDLYLYGPSAQSVLTDPAVADSNGPTYPKVFQYVVPSPGYYYIDAYAHAGYGSYSLTYGVKSAGAAADDDVPGVTAPASPIMGSLDSILDVDDVYALNLVVGQTVRVSLTGASGSDFDAYLYGPGAISVKTDDPVASAMGLTYPDDFTYVVPTTGKYYLDAFAYSGSGAYSLGYEISSGSADPDGDVPGTAFGTSPRAGTLDDTTDRADVYSMSLTAGQQVSLTLTGPSASDFDLYLFGPGTTSVYVDNALASSTGPGSVETITYTALTSGTYYIAGYAYSGSGAYTLACGVPAVDTYTLTYTAGANGTIRGTSQQTVTSGASGTAVTAVPNTGYHFTSWSDGWPTAARTDTNVTANKSVTANFAIDAPSTYTLTYTAGAGGTISGTSPQTVNSGASGTQVTAVPNTGFHFVNWSDGWPTAARTDTNVTANKSVTVSFAADGTPPSLMPVYRFYNLKMGVHFYTASATEMATVRDTLYRTYRLEGVAYNLNTANLANNTSLYRFYNIKKGVHFYTASEAEKDSVVRTLSSTYRLEGVAYRVCATPVAGATPVYRFYNLKQGVHFYTASEAEKANVVRTLSSTYHLEGVGYYLAP